MSEGARIPPDEHMKIVIVNLKVNCVVILVGVFR